MVKLRGQGERRRIETPISHIELVPTLLEALAGEVPQGLDGQSRAAECWGSAVPAELDVVVVWNRDDGHDNDNLRFGDAAA